MPVKKTFNRTPIKKGKKKKSRRRSIGGVSGLFDILPRDGDCWRAVWNAGHTVSELHNFHFIETPVVEAAPLFERGLGEEGIDHMKNLYTFKIRKDESPVAFKADGAVTVLRSYLEHQLGRFSSPLHVFYHGPVFCRQRTKDVKHHSWQWGFSIVGASDPLYDASIVVTLVDFLSALGINNIVLKINAVGCRVCRPTFYQKLKDYYGQHKKSLCEKCRLNCEKFPVRLSTCDKETCKEVSRDAPITLNHLCQGCNNHLKDLLEFIEDNKINYVPDHHFFGDKSYYNKAVFEILDEDGSSPALASGGRYDYLSEKIGGRQIQATGGMIHVDNVIEYIKDRKLKPIQKKRKVFFVAVGEQAKKSGLSLMQLLRRNGIITVEAISKKSLKSQLRAAQRSETPLTLIYGQREVFEDKVILRDMESGSQEGILLDNIVAEVKRRLK